MSVILSARLVRNPRKRRICEECDRPIRQNAVSLYGMVFSDDKPGTLTYHVECARRYVEQDSKIASVFVAYDEAAKAAEE